MKRSWILAVIVFGGALALANFVLVPLFCRGEFAIPLLDRANFCVGPSGLTRSASLLLYFGIVALALFVGIIFDKLPRRAPAEAEAKKAEASKPAAEPVEQAAAVTPTPSVAPTPAEAPQAGVPKPDAAPSAEVAKAEAPKPEGAAAAAETPAEAPKVDLAAVIEAALKSNAPLPTPAPPPVLPKPAPTSAVTPPAVPKPVPSATPVPPSTVASSLPPAPVLPPPPKPTPIPKPWQKPKAFDGTNEELIARFKELAKEGGVEAIAAAQRNLDESTLAALGGGVDPKQHLSQIAHLLLIEDPELKSEVSRGVVVHIAARLKELGVVTNLQPNTSA